MNNRRNDCVPDTGLSFWSEDWGSEGEGSGSDGVGSGSDASRRHSGEGERRDEDEVDIGGGGIARDRGVSDSGERGASWTSGATGYHVMERVSTGELGVTSELWVDSSSYSKISSPRLSKNSSIFATGVIVVVEISSSS